MKFSNYAQDLNPFLAMEVMERGMALQAAGKSIVQLGVGEPNFAPPEAVVEATHQALRDEMTHYTDSRGLAQLREANLRRFVEATRQSDFSGPSHRHQRNIARYLDGSASASAPGDELGLIPTPHYACYPNMVKLCGGIPVLIETSPEDGYRLDINKVKEAITEKTRGILIASPKPTPPVQSNRMKS